MAAYALTGNASIVRRNADGAFIPQDSHNNDWLAYQAWLTAGNTPDAHVEPALMPQDQFAAALANGINTTWTQSGGPDGSLNGLYAIDSQTLFNITAETVTILSSGKFSTGTPTRYWLNMAGRPMPMNTTQFQAFALAVGNYVNTLYAVLATLQAGQSMPWPSNDVTINA